MLLKLFHRRGRSSSNKTETFTASLATESAFILVERAIAVSLEHRVMAWLMREIAQLDSGALWSAEDRL